MTPDGFFFRRDAETVFEATRFQQSVDEHRVRLVADNQELDWPCPPLGEPPAKRLHVITRNVTPAEFDSIVEPLKKLCAASVTTGNPVAWT
ncbi:hypothetical protein DMH04_17005 [Kibdelosporangium aridum]|uniref:Uncharacterized protein n=1 Tax=Kibdelosporangium aridum TaxID=2030 RepID=A0A428ZBK4_KIBAR|nr:hypothetical protein [Kibdelosporangium aridum]RSM85454.1 hypothetical protein DMH04_17005 [Kibdelosporangium aridum]